MIAMPATQPARSPRDPRLDVWRGFAMLIIMVAHIPLNHWSNFIPARFGPSDAAEMFVFCSGFAAAIAFGGTFAKHNWWMGTRRIMFRCWQIYWAHLGLFFAIALICVIANSIVGPDGTDYTIKLNIIKFFETTEITLVGLFTLTWVPNYFDILPMYMVILLMVPIVMALRQVHDWAPMIFCVGLYIATWVFDLQLPAEPWSERHWFFNPFAWQLLFFTGFMLSRGWIKGPAFDWRLITLGIAFVLIMIPISRWQIYTTVEPFDVLGITVNFHAIHDVIWLKDWGQAGIFKTNEHPLRILHVLTLTYLAVCLVKGREAWLTRWPLSVIERVGQQALAAFLWSMAFAWALGVVLDNVERSSMVTAIVNLVGLASVVAVAYIASWYKRQPWRQTPQRVPAEPATQTPVGVPSTA